MSAILSAFKDVDLRKKILFTIAMIILYRIDAGSVQRVLAH